MTGCDNPGSPEAVAKGCTCPVFDNNHGRGVEVAGVKQFWIDDDCSLHGTKEADDGN